jgi:hypothetical protein
MKPDQPLSPEPCAHLEFLLASTMRKKSDERILRWLTRVKVIRKPTEGTVDGINLQRFRVGAHYEVGSLIGGLLLAEGWAELVPSDEPAALVPTSELGADDPSETPANLIREIYPPYYDGPSSHPADRRLKSRRPR